MDIFNRRTLGEMLLDMYKIKSVITYMATERNTYTGARILRRTLATSLGTAAGLSVIVSSSDYLRSTAKAMHTAVSNNYLPEAVGVGYLTGDLLVFAVLAVAAAATTWGLTSKAVRAITKEPYPPQIYGDIY